MKRRIYKTIHQWIERKHEKMMEHVHSNHPSLKPNNSSYEVYYFHFMSGCSHDGVILVGANSLNESTKIIREQYDWFKSLNGSYSHGMMNGVYSDKKGIIADWTKGAVYLTERKPAEEDLIPIPEYASIYTVDEFINMRKSGYISSYDGVGFLATDTQQSRVWASHAMDKEYMKEHPQFTHVAWYNK